MKIAIILRTDAIRSFLVIFILFSPLLLAQKSIAILDFEGKGVSVIEASALTDRLRTELFKTGVFKVLERGIMDEILEEQGFQETGCVSTECIVEVGEKFGVEQMIAGSISRVGDVYSVSARMVSVLTGEIINISTFDHVGNIGNLLIFGMSAVAADLAGIPRGVAEAPRITRTETPLSRVQQGTGQKKSVSGAVIRNLILPGWGHSYAGNKRRGKFFFWMFAYGVMDAVLGPGMGVQPFESGEFGGTTFVISEGIAYIAGSIDAAVTAAKYNKSLQERE